MNNLETILETHSGKATDTWSSYASHYDVMFSQLRKNPIRLLEIGIQNGGCLEIWSKYFGSAEIIAGCDIDPNIRKLNYKEEKIKTICGDIVTNRTEKLIDEISSYWDIIIDDGSHRSSDIVGTFARFFPKLAQGGIYIVEDIHCSYWSEFEGGLNDDASSISFFKRLVDIVNFEHWGFHASRVDYVEPFAERYGSKFEEEVLNQIHSVEFVNSICVIRKRPADGNELGVRCIRGGEMLIADGLKKYDGDKSVPLQQSLANKKFNFRDALDFKDQDASKLKEFEEQIARLKTENDEQLKAHNEQTKLLNEDKDAQLKEFEEQIARLKTENDEQLKAHNEQTKLLNEDKDAQLKEFEEQIARLKTENDEQLKAHNEQTKLLNEDKDAQLKEFEEQIARLKTENDEQLKAHNEQTKLLNEDKDAQLKELNQQIIEFVRFQSKPSARLARLIERQTKNFFPLNTRRRKLLSSSVTFADKVYRQGARSVFKSRVQALSLASSKMQNLSLIDGNTEASPNNFALFVNYVEPDDGVLSQQEQNSEKYNSLNPKFSIVLPVYKIDPCVLKAAILSVINQSWKNWELCIGYADLENKANLVLLREFAKSDKRIRVKKLRENGGISRNSNAILKFARGEFVVLLDHDDELTPWALYDMAQAVATSSKIDFLYSDKDSIDDLGNIRINPLFKPEWSPEMLYSVNYLTHMNVIRREIVNNIGGWDPLTDGAQDWDLFLRAAEQSREIERITSIHYHWRIIEGSTSTGIEAKPYAQAAQLRTIEKRLERVNLPATVVPHVESGFKIIWKSPSERVLDVIIRIDDHGLDVNSFISSVIGDSLQTVASITILCANRIDEMILADHGVPISVFTETQNRSSHGLVDAIAQGTAPAVLIIDQSILHLASKSIEDISGWVLNHPEISFASSLVLLQDDTVVEAGRVVGDGNLTQPLFRGTPLRHWGAFGGPLWYRNVTAASATLVAFKRECLNLDIASDISWSHAVTALCQGSAKGGLRGLISPHARAYVQNLPELEDHWDDTMRQDRFFHPAFKSVTPLELGHE